jgi:hypothetical protein
MTDLDKAKVALYKALMALTIYPTKNEATLRYFLENEDCVQRLLTAMIQDKPTMSQAIGPYD